MKVYIDCQHKKITKVEPSPIYFGNNNVDKIQLVFSNTDDITASWYPTLSATTADKNSVYPRLYDTDGITEEGTTKTYDFTLSNDNGWNLTPGRTLFFVWINYPDTSGNECVGSFGANILASSGYYQVDNPVVNPDLREYLDETFEKHYNEVNTEFSELKEDIEDEVKKDNEYQLAIINNLVGGQPRYVDTSSNILALTSNQGVAVGTDTGHWYYWNGTQYVDSGSEYLPAVPSDVSSKIDNLITSFDEVEYLHVVNDRYINSSGVQGNISDNDLYYIQTEENVCYLVYSSPLSTLPYVYFNGKAYLNGLKYAVFIGNGTTAFINNASSNTTLKIYKSRIDTNYNNINNTIVSEDITDDVVLVGSSKYINNAGGSGGMTGYNLYRLDTKPNYKYIIKCSGNGGSTTIPFIYYNATAYPTTRTANYQLYGTYLIEGNGTCAFINNYAKVGSLSVIELSQSGYNNELSIMADNLFTDVNATKTENRYINSSGTQGTLSGLDLYSFLSVEGALYHITTGSNRANLLPFIYMDGPNPSERPYGDTYDTYIYGNGGIIYVNGNSSYCDTSIKVFNVKEETTNIMTMFKDIVCCGDSLTYSQVYLSSTSSRQANVTYPQCLAKLSGSNVSSLATGGYSTIDWWNAYSGNIESGKLYIVYLGTNGGLTDTVDTDCNGDDYTAYSSNYTGTYGKIIRKILDSGSKCIMIKITATSGSVSVTNSAIDSLGEKFDVPVLPAYAAVLNDDNYHKSPTDSTYSNSVHLNDLGYSKFAYLVFNGINSLSTDELYKLIV